jgi:hypothetical protein
MVDVESRQKAKSIAQRRELGALANDTKWGEFFKLVQQEAIPVEIKLINDESVFQCGVVWSPVRNYIEGGGGMGPVLYVFVEWVRSSAAEKLKAAATEVGLECQVSDGMATVYGYR